MTWDYIRYTVDLAVILSLLYMWYTVGRLEVRVERLTEAIRLIAHGPSETWDPADRND